MTISRHSRRSRNTRNAALAVVVPVPALVFHYTFLFYCPSGTQRDESHNLNYWSDVCQWGRDHPVGLLNSVFFLNVNVLFWIISLIQRSTWLIDPYWTIIPVMIGHFYGTHPRTKSDLWRSKVVLILLWIWSIRLTHSYFRRENWQWGEREDWRFSQLRKQHSKHWWWMSFFAVYFSQQIFLVGICLPLYAVHSSQAPWNIWDTVATVVCGSGITIAYYADSQLHAFTSKNIILKDLGVPSIPLLQEGLWRYSRHPNYFGEQLWWWGLALYAWNLGKGWMVAGAAINSASLVYVTILVERKMLEKSDRADLYRKYQETTSVWIPWFRFRRGTDLKKIH